MSLSVTASDAERRKHYEGVCAAIDSLLADESDWVAAMATVVCELHHAFEYFNWTGFYRAAQPDLLVSGPYQGGHGCLRIPFSRGVCGAAARTRAAQRVDDVHAVADHIACSASTQSELVVPVLGSEGAVIAVLDVDSDTRAAFTLADENALASLCSKLGERYGGTR